MQLVRIDHSELGGALARQTQDLLDLAFPDMAEQYYQGEIPRKLILLLDDDTVVGHLAAYIRQVSVGGEPMEIGILGGVAIAPNYRGKGLSKRLIAAAHQFLVNANIGFAVLFAFEPERYLSSGYRRMTTQMRFTEHGEIKQFVYRGGMVAELGDRPWPDALLDLKGPTV